MLNILNLIDSLRIKCYKSVKYRTGFPNLCCFLISIGEWLICATGCSLSAGRAVSLLGFQPAGSQLSRFCLCLAPAPSPEAQDVQVQSLRQDVAFLTASRS
jgi:hypothetical protein